MSKNYNEQRTKKLADKYRKFREKQSQSPSASKITQILSVIHSKCQTIWSFMVPYAIRNYSSEYQLFNFHWKSEIGKVCMNELISPFSIESNLKEYRVGKPIVLALVYSPSSMKNIISFITRINAEQLKKSYLFCPLNIEQHKYQSEFQNKINYSDQSFLILWRGLFNQMIVLNRYKIYEINVFNCIHSEIQNRIDYENKIKTCAYPLASSSTQIMMGQQ